MKKIKIIIFVSITIITLIIGALAGYYAYNIFKKPILTLSGKDSIILTIPTNASYDQVMDSLTKNANINSLDLLNYIAAKRNYTSNIKPGKYLLTNKMTSYELISKLRSGDQIPVKVTFNNIRFLPKLAGIVSRKLEFDSTQLINLLQNPNFLDELGYKQETVIALFLPNTYEFWWNTSPEQFVLRMQQEYLKFWDTERLNKAKLMNLNPLEVSILASIVQEETNNSQEMSRIAGVYMNRLKVGMLLQADPTARFAYGDFSVQRITYDYLKIDSPYNTYQYAGLPPGPICMANPNTIDKVLDYEQHSYYYFCAKADNSGTHAFARNHNEHIRNANQYRQYLNRLNIRR